MHPFLELVMSDVLRDSELALAGLDSLLGQADAVVPTRKVVVQCETPGSAPDLHRVIGGDHSMLISFAQLWFFSALSKVEEADLSCQSRYLFDLTGSSLHTKEIVMYIFVFPICFSKGKG